MWSQGHTGTQADQLTGYQDQDPGSKNLSNPVQANNWGAI